MPGHVIVEMLNFDHIADGRTRLVIEASFHTKEDADGMFSSGMEDGMNESYAAVAVSAASGPSGFFCFPR